MILEQRPHPEQGFRACLGVVRLARPYGAERLEAAAERAIDIGARTYGSVQSILDNHLDPRPAPNPPTDGTPAPPPTTPLPPPLPSNNHPSPKIHPSSPLSP